jgi:hypothetical protein
MAAQFQTQAGNDLTYDQYFELLKSAAIQLDAIHAPKQYALPKQ